MFLSMDGMPLGVLQMLGPRDDRQPIYDNRQVFFCNKLQYNNSTLKCFSGKHLKQELGNTITIIILIHI